MALLHIAKRGRGLCLIAAVIVSWLGFAPVPEAMAGPLAQRFAAYVSGSPKTVDHSAWTALLRRYVVAGKDGLNRVNYARFKKGGRAALTQYLAALQKVPVPSLDRPEQFAFWINLYNALTVSVVLDHYPVGSIRDIQLGGLFSRGPWKQKLVTVEGVKLSLDDIEHEILRPIWRDPRIHYAVNCASVGCPNLARKAYAGARLEEMLNAAAKSYVNSPRGVAVQGDGVVLSSIYRWYDEDFGGSKAAVLAHLRSYAAPELHPYLKATAQISGYEYNWRLNDTR